MSDGNSYGPFYVASGPQGSQGPQGDQGPQGEQGPQGPQGEVSAGDLSFAIGGTSANSNTVQTLDTTGFSDPPTLNDLLAVASKLNELINALRR